MSYEKYLRGEKGIKFIQKDRFNRDIGSYNNGLNDKNSIAGKDLIITIDSELQEYGELLMSNKGSNSCYRTKHWRIIIISFCSFLQP